MCHGGILIQLILWFSCRDGARQDRIIMRMRVWRRAGLGARGRGEGGGPSLRSSRPRVGGSRVATRVLAFPEDDEGSASSSGKKRGFLDLSFGAELLDFLEAGPKMRKWYGAPEKGTDVLDLSLKKEIAPNTDDRKSRPSDDRVARAADVNTPFSAFE